MDKRKLKPNDYDRYKDGLRQLGMTTYEEYLRSGLWKGFGTLYRSRKRLPQFCLVCESPQFELHHVSYARLGNELLTDVVPLCRQHHEELHEWLQINRMPLKKIHRQLVECFGIDSKVASKRLKPARNIEKALEKRIQDR